MNFAALLEDPVTLIAGASAIGVMAVGYLLLGNTSNGPSSKGKKRTRAISKGDGVGKKENRIMAMLKQDDSTGRRKQIEESLGNLEQDQKDKRKKHKSLKSKLIQANWSMSAQTYTTVSIVVGVVLGLVGFVLGMPIHYAGGLGFIVGFGLPRWLLNFFISRRQAKFTMHFSDAMDIIVRGVRTGLPLGDCLKIIAHESQEPVRSEFLKVVEAEGVGVPIETCLERMYDRMPVSEVNFFSTVLNIQRSSGGNLGEALSNLSSVLRGRKLLKMKIKALSAEAKMSGIIIGILPPSVMGLVSLTAPDYMLPLYTTTRGQKNLMIGAAMMVMGILAMRKMINFKF